MKRVIFDTSVYGELVRETNVAEALVKMVPAEYVVYGTKIIRNELRNVSREARVEGKSKRNLLLRLYDTLVRKARHDLDITALIEVIASEFYKKYRAYGGSKSLKEMRCSCDYGAKAHSIVVHLKSKQWLESHSINYGVLTMINDFRIVACASFYNLDIVVSNDERSMLCKEALQAYRTVCKEFKLHPPEFIPYRNFKEMIIRG